MKIVFAAALLIFNLNAFALYIQSLTNSDASYNFAFSRSETNVEPRYSYSDQEVASFCSVQHRNYNYYNNY